MQPGSCPTVTTHLPDNKSNSACDTSVDPDLCACSTIANPDLCFYADPDPDWVGASDVVCGCIDRTPDDGSSDTFWTCQDRRVDATGLSLKMSSDCGVNWSSQYFDMVSLGLPTGGGGGTIDRPELYVDPYADRLFVSGSMTPVFGDLRSSVGGESVMVVGAPASAATADAINFSVYKQDPFDGGPVVMTTVPDEQARFSDGTLGSYVYVVRAHCSLTNEPRVEVRTPFGWKMVNLSEGRGPDFLCRLAVEPTVPIVNHAPNITVTGIPSVPPKVRIAYPALNSGRQIVQVFVVTLRSTGGYSTLQNEAELELTVTPEASAAYAFFPQLIPVDGVAGSDGRRDTPAVLRYVVRTSQQLSEKRDRALLGPQERSS
jgi:hypothetical protein